MHLSRRAHRFIPLIDFRFSEFIVILRISRFKRLVVNVKNFGGRPKS